MEQDLKEIINISIFAPSGDNSQPWRFKIKNNIPIKAIKLTKKVLSSIKSKVSIIF